MFRETLLESAPGTRRRKRWPMILAVALEVTVCSVLVAVPLFSSGIIPVAARPVDHRLYQPTPIVDTRPVRNTGGTGQGSPIHHTSVVTIVDGKTCRTFGPPQPPSDDDPPITNVSGPSGPSLPVCDRCVSSSRPSGPGRDRPLLLSGGVTEGYLIHRVDPVYPHIAAISGVGGEVRLHAIISKDGIIESLTLISGHPLLAKPAMDAVQQWRYRPSLLNHEPVEVETLITVKFTTGR
jgi:periplasmic protein TonB